MAAHVNAFLINFYKVFPELMTVDVSNEGACLCVSLAYTAPKTYLAGESFAGQYIPYIGTIIVVLSNILSADESALASRRHFEDHAPFNATKRSCHRKRLDRWETSVPSLLRLCVKIGYSQVRVAG